MAHRKKYLDLKLGRKKSETQGSWHFVFLLPYHQFEQLSRFYIKDLLSIFGGFLVSIMWQQVSEKPSSFLDNWLSFCLLQEEKASEYGRHHPWLISYCVDLLLATILTVANRRKLK